MAKITQLSQLDLNGTYSYADYLTWQFETDWVIAIMSKENAKQELHFKYALYEKTGVREYWQVYPSVYVVLQFVLNAEIEKYQLIAMFANDEIISPTLFPDLKIDLAEVFAE